jgi:hypothetical protein
MDISQVGAGLAAVKTAFDALKSAVDLARRVKDALPSGSEKDRAAAALEDAERKMAEAEASVAEALGYTLCRCQFPPTPMLMVGHIPNMHLSGIDRGKVLSQPARAGGGMTGSIPVHQCPKCKTTDAPSYQNFQRTVPEQPHA